MQNQQILWLPIEQYEPQIDPNDIDFIDFVVLFQPHSQGGFCFVGFLGEGVWRDNLVFDTYNPTHFSRSIPYPWPNLPPLSTDD